MLPLSNVLSSLPALGAASVNLLIGTSGAFFHPGNTSPAATTPFGLVRLGPDSVFDPGASAVIDRLGNSTAGYDYERTKVVGFSHTRLSGAGVSEGGLFRVSPMTSKPLKLDHSSEQAEPGYYRARFAPQSLDVELTATPRCGIHRYTRTQGRAPIRLSLDAASRLFNGSRSGPDARAAFDPDTGELTATANAFGEFSKRYGGMRSYAHGGLSEKPARTRLHARSSRLEIEFAPGTDRVELKLCMSMVSPQNARLNFEKEVRGRSFGELRTEAAESWSSILSRVQASFDDPDSKVVFDTALYHSFLMPTLFTDANGEYRGIDRKVKRATARDGGFNYRTDLSLWDTFRTTHPLYTLIAPEIQRDTAQSLLAMARTRGSFPLWPSGTGETGCMIGSPANFLMAETFLKGVPGFSEADAREALAFMTNAAEKEGSCRLYGYCPGDLSHESVSKTLEYAWADHATANLALALGEAATAERYTELSRSYRLLWDWDSGFFRPKDQFGGFMPFSPHVLSWLGPLGRNTHAYTEGNANHWSYTVPHEPRDLVQLMGGESAFVQRLDRFFQKAGPTRNSFIPSTNYWHGNEQNFHVPYLFNEAGRPDLTQKWVRWIMDTRYANAPDGLDGNDDAGALSSWYVFSALGLYPQAGSDRYWLGSPLVREATLRLSADRTLTVRALNQSPSHPYVQRVLLNGRPLTRPELRHSELTAAAASELVFEMGPAPAPGGGY